MNVSNNYYSYVICILRLSILKLWVSCIPVNLTVGLKKKKKIKQARDLNMQLEMTTTTY